VTYVNDEGAFLAAIIAQPDDDSVRLVFADWLEEHGDPDRAAFIRLQIRQAQVPEGGPEYRDLSNRAEVLHKRHRETWLVDLPQVIARHAPLFYFKRGFLTELSTRTAVVAGISTRAWSKHPIQELTLSKFRGRLDRVLALPHMPRIRKLCLHGERYMGGMAHSDLEALARCPNLMGLRELLIHSEIGNAVAGAVASCPSLTGLTDLSLHDKDLDATGLTTLIRTGAATGGHLERLHLGSHRIDPVAARVLAGAPALAALELLDLRGRVGPNPAARIGDEGATVLAHSLRLAGLRRLWLSHQGIGPGGARSLAASPHLTGLRGLSLSNNPIRAAGARALVDGRWTELTDLNLSWCDLDDEGAKVLAGAHRLSKLTRLDLKYNDIGKVGAIALSRSTRFGELRSLDLTNNPIGDDGARALCASTALKKLKELEVELPEEDFSPAVEKALKKRFGTVE
jgi:uncharacterized protein (TIGR02996 family)